MTPAWARQGPVARAIASPVRLGLGAALVAGAWSVLRVLVAGKGHMGALVVAGSRYVVRTPFTAGLPIRAGTGYDGQFYFRMALRPWDFDHSAFGVTFDTLGRLDRVTYPAVVWALSAGQHQAVASVMLLANVGAFGALTGLAAGLARHCGRHPLYGLLVSGYWGFLWTLGRDLTELTEATFVVAGLLALRKGRPLWAGAALALAALAREEAIIYAGAILACRALKFVAPRFGLRLGPGAPGASRADQPGASSHRPPRYPDLAWALPFAAFVAWQLVLRAGTGSFPALTSGGNNSTIPLVGAYDGILYHLHRMGQISTLIWFVELVALLGMTVLAATSAGTGGAPWHERIAWAAFALLALSLAKGIWTGDAGFRSFDDLYLMSALLVLSSSQDARLPALAIGTVWGAVAVELLAFI